LFSEKLAVLIWQFEDLGFDGNQVDRINLLFYKNCIQMPLKIFFIQSGNLEIKPVMMGMVLNRKPYLF
jgi:hypothetical protein